MANCNPDRKFTRAKSVRLASASSVSKDEFKTFGRERSKTISLTLKELVDIAESRIKGLKESQQGVTNEGLNAKNEKQTLLETIRSEFEFLHKMLDRKFRQMVQGLTQTMENYINELEGFGRKFEEEMTELDLAVSKAKNQDTIGMSMIQFEDRMMKIKAELEESIDTTRDESIDAAIAKSKRPQLKFQPQTESFRELISNVGWIEHKVDYSVRTAIDSPVHIEKTKETLPFLPVDVAVNADGAVYVLDASRDAGYLHFFINGNRLNLIQLSKEVKTKRTPNSLCLNLNHIFVSFPEADLVAAIPKKVGETKLITPQSIAHITPGIKSPHGLACSLDNLLIADTGNNRVIVLRKFNQVVKVLRGTIHAPLYAPKSISATQDGVVAVLHSAGHSVHIYNIISGILVHRTCSFEVAYANPVEAWVPYKLAISPTPRGDSYEIMLSACFQGEQTLLRFNPDTGWMCRQGRTGNKFGQFKEVKGVAYNPYDETILTCDYGNERIQVFDN